MDRMDRTERIAALYRAFNDRDLEAVLDAMTPDVDWPNGWEGGRLEGRAAVRRYWERQWAQVRPMTTVKAVAELPDGSVEASVHLVVRDPAGLVLDRSTVTHVYEFAGPLVRRMTQRP